VFKKKAVIVAAKGSLEKKKEGSMLLNGRRGKRGLVHSLYKRAKHSPMDSTNTIRRAGEGVC